MKKTIPNLAVEIVKVIGNYTIEESENQKIVEIEDIPSILRMIANDYSRWIDKEMF